VGKKCKMRSALQRTCDISLNQRKMGGGTESSASPTFDIYHVMETLRLGGASKKSGGGGGGGTNLDNIGGAKRLVVK